MDPVKVPTFDPFLSSIGGSQLTITGEGFGSTGTAVTIGDVECDVISQSASEVVCTLPGHGPGTYAVEVTVGNQGYADVR